MVSLLPLNNHNLLLGNSLTKSDFENQSLGISKANNAKEAVGCPGQTFLKVEVGGGGQRGGQKKLWAGYEQKFLKVQGGHRVQSIFSKTSQSVMLLILC